MKKGSKRPETQRVKYSVRQPEQDRRTILKTVSKLRKVKARTGKKK
jgi:hypothetical protein